MKQIILFIAVVFFCFACNQNNLPKNVLGKQEMINLMLDMQLTDAILNQVNDTDSMKMYAHSRYSYLFSKYKIDSASFSNSLKYYSKDPVEIDSMYSIVSDSLIRLQDKLKPKLDTASNDNYFLQLSLNRFLLNNFSPDTGKFTNINPYAFDAKVLFERYNNSSESLRLKDSLKLNKLNELRKDTTFKNDISTK